MLVAILFSIQIGFAILLVTGLGASFLYFVYRILHQDSCLCNSNLQLHSFIYCVSCSIKVP